MTDDLRGGCRGAVEVGYVVAGAQVAELASRTPPRLEALVLLGTYATLRWGELGSAAPR
jgi:hypothetical protein